eukprot:TRINITY_DN4136_c0_g1_i2.p1 TRINITY_DN4136_c0_g1~~TRINITY_DN4136_c0_g1_i2.p1  ORF type:complete len:252 (-),score=23.01 TRINITY_DN4136_c0_g1_i2:35-790(-)
MWRICVGGSATCCELQAHQRLRHPSVPYEEAASSAASNAQHQLQPKAYVCTCGRAFSLAGHLGSHLKGRLCPLRHPAASHRSASKTSAIVGSAGKTSAPRLAQMPSVPKKKASKPSPIQSSVINASPRPPKSMPRRDLSAPTPSEEPLVPEPPELSEGTAPAAVLPPATTRHEDSHVDSVRPQLKRKRALAPEDGDAKDAGRATPNDASKSSRVLRKRVTVASKTSRQVSVACLPSARFAFAIVECWFACV